jgi:glycogen(starch) synthase
MTAHFAQDGLMGGGGGSPDGVSSGAGVLRAPASSVLFEIAWEVCNQLGGIYQVIRSKAPLMTSRWGDRYTLVGPYEPGKANVEFEPTSPSGWMGRVIEQLHHQGLRVHHGRWLIPGRPRALLIEQQVPWQELDKIKFRLWSDHGIQSPAGDAMMDGVVSFADAVRRLFEAISFETGLGSSLPQTAARTGPIGPRGVIAHFHEYMGGLAIPMMRKQGLPIATVFTTHATLLGRFIALSGGDLYGSLGHVNPAAEAEKFNIKFQFGAERACAHGAHVFTTVSSITAEECTSLLGRPVDLVTPNGLNVERYNKQHDQQRLHAEFKEAIHRFTMGYFFPSYSFDLDKTIYCFSSGRFEPRNKGFDLCLESMARLNAELKSRQNDERYAGKTVIFFIITRRPTKSINPAALEMRGVLNELREVCNRITDGVAEKLFKRSASHGALRLDDLVDEYWMLRYRRAQHALKQHWLPMVVTHNLEDDQNDPVLNHIRTLGLVNRKEDPVKVVYHPDFITPTNRLWGIEYDEFVRGCHMGLFPSAYEPWGYTPLECLAMGVPAVSSDLAGFGRYVREHSKGVNPDDWGMYVVDRRFRDYHNSASQLTGMLLNYCRMDRRERIALRNEVDRHSWDFDWSKLGVAYHEAHDMALARCEAQFVNRAEAPKVTT